MQPLQCSMNMKETFIYRDIETNNCFIKSIEEYTDCNLKTVMTII